ncbi:MAG: glycosyltransferase [Bacteroidales bacterium]|nr:glycosyltransferase [Bacteroidales bacterium]
MKICHIITSIDQSGGGPSKSVCDLSIQLAQQGLDIHLLTQASENPYIQTSPHKKLELHFVQGISFSLAIKQQLTQEHFDLLHSHGIWQMPVHYAAQLAKKNNIPYIISTRGMLEPWALNYKKWKKKLALWIYQNNDLKKAACIHATGKMEAQHIRQLGYTNPIAIIPNPIELKEKKTYTNLKKEKKRLAFIGRLHKIKNIESLMHAWTKIKNTQDWELVLVGDGEKNYVQSLKQLVANLQIQNILFTGFLAGEEKEKIMQTLDFVVLPSFSENFGMVVGEALQNEIPVIASTGTPWDDLQKHQCGWWVNNDVETLSQTIQQAIALSDEERQQMGQRGRKLIEEKYSVEIVASQMIQLYEWILKGGTKPEFVYEL